MASATRKIALNTAVQIIGKILITLVAGASVVILTRYLGPVGYGKFNLALVYLQIFGILADVGLFTIVVREISKDPKQTSKLVGNAMTLRLLLSVAVLVVAFGTSFLLPYTPDVRWAILIAAGSILFGLLNSSMVTVFQARLRMDYSVIADSVGRLVSFAAVVVVAGLNLGFYAVVTTAVIGALATLLVTYAFARRMTKIRFLTDKKVWKKLFISSIPLGIALALNQIYFRADTFLLSLFRSYQEVGLYALAFKILEIVLTFPGFFMNSVFPLLSKYIAEKDKRVKTTIQKSADFFLILGLPVMVGGYFVAPQLIRLAGGPQFAAAALPLQILLAAAVVSFLNGLFGYALIAKDRQKNALWLNVMGLVFNVVVNLIVIPPFGMVAAAITTLVSEILVFGGAFFLMRKYFGFFPHFRLLPRTAAATVVMAIPLVFLPGGPILLLVPVAATVYAVALAALGVVDRDLIGRLRTG